MAHQVVLAGPPNSGKTALFNALTGLNQKVANFSGVTVESKTGTIQGLGHELVDLPGIYGLDTTTLDEKVAKDYLLQRHGVIANTTILVIDSTNLRKGLYLALQLKEIGKDFIVALALCDESKRRGQKIDTDMLGRILETEVVEVSARTKEGLDDLKSRLIAHAPNSELNVEPGHQQRIKGTDYVRSKFEDIETILKQVIVSPIRENTLTKRIDKWVLHPWVGPVILLSVLGILFQALYAWAGPVVELIEGGFEFLGGVITSALGESMLTSFLVDGVLAGVGGMAVFLPHVAILFGLIFLLEDIGYLGRAAFLMDYWMRKLGLPGKSVIPLLSSHACAIPGIMGARIIENEKDRLATMLVAPLTTCSARLPVYALLIAALIPDQFGLPGLTLLALYCIGMGSAFIVAWFLKKRIIPGSPSLLLMELPPYRAPSLKGLAKHVWLKASIFVKKVTTVIVILTIGIWFLVSFPKTDQGVHGSYAAMVGKRVQTVFAPLGFDWRLSTALIPSFGAREVMVSALSTILMVEEAESEEETERKLTTVLKDSFSTAALFALMVWFIFAPQCISTFAVLKKETGGWKWPAVVGGYTLVLAYGLAAITYQVVSAIT